MKVNYTEEDDKIILNEISQLPNNISAALRNASKLLNRSFNACSQRYYSCLRYNNKVISVVSDKGLSTLNNQKNCPVLFGLSNEDITDLIKEQLRKLPRKYKLEIIHSMFNR